MSDKTRHLLKDWTESDLCSNNVSKLSNNTGLSRNITHSDLQNLTPPPNCCVFHAFQSLAWHSFFINIDNNCIWNPVFLKYAYLYSSSTYVHVNRLNIFLTM